MFTFKTRPYGFSRQELGGFKRNISKARHVHLVALCVVKNKWFKSRWVYIRGFRDHKLNSSFRFVSLLRKCRSVITPCFRIGKMGIQRIPSAGPTLRPWTCPRAWGPQRTSDLSSVPSKEWTVPSLSAWKFRKIRDDFDLDGQLDSIALEARSNPTARRGRNHLKFFKIFMQTGTKLSTLSMGQSIMVVILCVPSGMGGISQGLAVSNNGTNYQYQLLRLSQSQKIGSELLNIDINFTELYFPYFWLRLSFSSFCW